MDLTELQSLPRKTIQHVCKKCGIKANQKTREMIEQLIAKYPAGVPRALAYTQPNVKQEEESTSNSLQHRRSMRLVSRPLAGGRPSIQPTSTSASSHPILDSASEDATNHTSVTSMQADGPSGDASVGQDRDESFGEAPLLLGSPWGHRTPGMRGPISPEVPIEGYVLQQAERYAQSPIPEPVAGPSRVLGLQFAPEATRIVEGVSQRPFAQRVPTLPDAPNRPSTGRVGPSRREIRSCLRKLPKLFNEQAELMVQVRGLYKVTQMAEARLASAHERLDRLRDIRNAVEEVFLGELKHDLRLADGSRGWQPPTAQEEEERAIPKLSSLPDPGSSDSDESDIIPLGEGESSSSSAGSKRKREEEDPRDIEVIIKRAARRARIEREVIPL